MKYLIYILFLSIFSLNAQDGTLLWSSGFEGSISIGAQTGDYKYITGTDSDTGYSWPPDFWDSGVSTANGIHTLGVSNSADYTNEIVTITKDGDPTNKAFHVKVNTLSGSGSTQSPYQINEVWENGVHDTSDDTSEPVDWEYYYKSSIRLDDLSQLSYSPSNWVMIWQYKSDNWDDLWQFLDGDKDGYRISLFIFKDAGGTPYFRTQADWHPSGSENYWYSDSEVTVPTEEWFDLEIYQKVSRTSNGQFWIKVNGVKIADAPNVRNLGVPDNSQGTTYNSVYCCGGSASRYQLISEPNRNPDTMWYWTLWQYYTNTTGGEMWIDDIEVWDGLPADEVEAPTFSQRKRVKGSQIKTSSGNATIFGQ